MIKLPIYLYIEDIQLIVIDNTNVSDSIKIINNKCKNYIIITTLITYDLEEIIYSQISNEKIIHLKNEINSLFLSNNNKYHYYIYPSMDEVEERLNSLLSHISLIVFSNNKYIMDNFVNSKIKEMFLYFEHSSDAYSFDGLLIQPNNYIYTKIRVEYFKISDESELQRFLLFETGKKITNMNILPDVYIIYYRIIYFFLYVMLMKAFYLQI